MNQERKTVEKKIAWPAIPDPDAARLIAVMDQLSQSEWWHPQEIERHQFQQLNILLHHAYQHTTYYRRQFDQLGIRLQDHLSSKIWRSLPILKRQDIQEFRENLQSRSLPKSHGGVFEVKTSGSTGKPIQINRSEMSNFFGRAFTLREHYWHNRNFSGTLAVIRNIDGDVINADYPHGLISREWGQPVSSIYQTGHCGLLDIKTTVADQVDWLKRLNPHYLLTFASNAYALALFCQKHAIDLPNLTQVRTMSEVVDTRLRDICLEVWGATVTDIYSTEEAGYLALQCPEYEVYHIQSEGVYVEILNEQDQPCKPGEIGRVIVTPLHNFATPLIRYEIGDYAEVGKSCLCGRSLPVLKRILGRARNMLILPSGDQRWPVIPHWLFSKVAPIRQYQIIQKTPTYLEFSIIAPRSLTLAEEESVRQIILTSTSFAGINFDIVFRYPQELRRSNRGKFEDFISEVKLA